MRRVGRVGRRTLVVGVVRRRWARVGHHGQRPPDGGAASFVVAGVLAVVICLGIAGIVLGGYVVAVHRARSAADLAALSGAAEFAQGGRACGAAGRTAADNHATLVACDQVGDQLDFVITARVRVRVGRTMPGLPQSVEAIAYAGAESG